MLTRAKWFCGLAIGIAGSFCISESDATAWHFSELTPTTQVYVDGVGETAQDRLLAFSECSDKALERGEYETKQEFEERKRNAQTDCASLRRVKSYLESKVSLKYNADNFYFTFPIVQGELVVPKRRFKHGRILISYNFYDGTCPPSSRYRPGSGRKSISSSTRWEFYDVYDCPSFDLHVDKNFFTGGRILFPVQVKFDPVQCTCVKKLFGKCDRYSCDPHPMVGPTNRPVPVTLRLNAPIERARALKAMEDSLRLRLEGEFISWRNKKGYFFEMQRVVLVNQENDTTLFSVSGGG